MLFDGSQEQVQLLKFEYDAAYELSPVVVATDWAVGSRTGAGLQLDMRSRDLTAIDALRFRGRTFTVADVVQNGRRMTLTLQE